MDSRYVDLENPRAATPSRTECDPTRPERAACISPPQRGGRRIAVNQALQGRHIRSYCIVLEIHGSKAHRDGLTPTDTCSPARLCGVNIKVVERE